VSSKKRVEKMMSQVQEKYQRVLKQKRVEWLQRICREAKESYNFQSLGELVAFIINHASDIQLKEGSS